MDIRSSELTKYAANAMLATKISFMNEMANLAERVGADIESVRQGIGSDQRIGYHFIYAGSGYGGSCFPKDTRALVSIAADGGYDFALLRGVIETNDQHYARIAEKVIAACGGSGTTRTSRLAALSTNREVPSTRDGCSTTTRSSSWDPCFPTRWSG